MPRYQYTLQYEFLRSRAALAELQTLVGFFNARGGSFDSFLFLDVDDSTATAQPFGVGNGSTSQFQLLRSFGGFAEVVSDINATVRLIKVYVAGTLKTKDVDYVLAPTGSVTFFTPPSSGSAITWTGDFYRRVRFLRDQLDTTKFLQDLWEAKKVELLSIKAGST